MAHHTSYEDSKGQTHVIASMPFTYLQNATKKLRLAGNNPSMLESLESELARREETYRQKQEAEGPRD